MTVNRARSALRQIWDDINHNGDPVELDPRHADALVRLQHLNVARRQVLAELSNLESRACPRR